LTVRTFSSYGPVDDELHFNVPRFALVEDCVSQLLGHPKKGGHYFTIWAPRQTGKTWLMRQAVARIRRDYPEEYIVATLSMQGVMMAGKEDDAFLDQIPDIFQSHLDLEVPAPKNWGELKRMFLKDKGLFDRPLILLIDEFDSLPPTVIDILVTMFRDIYLNREHHNLHALALIGVRAVLGFSSDRGSPFNIQRSLEVPRFTHEEVLDLYRQYQEESGQAIEPQVVEAVWKATRGQPGLVCWFGELLTKKHNPDPSLPLGDEAWKTVYSRALSREPNNTILNMVAKARGKHREELMNMFVQSDIPFCIHQSWCNDLHLNGLLDAEEVLDDKGEKFQVCRFTSPFIQECLHKALCDDLLNSPKKVIPLNIYDDLADVFEGSSLDLPALLRRYTDYLERLQKAGLNPWKDQPTRSDLRITEAVGHFHLYWWMVEALSGSEVVVSPEFPTGNGKVDLHLRDTHRKGLVEVKVFRNIQLLKQNRLQVARYAQQVGLSEATLALFVPGVSQEEVARLLGTSDCQGVKVNVVAIGWRLE
jgi:hypothetical protein